MNSVAALRLSSEVRLHGELLADAAVQGFTRDILKEGRHEATQRRLLARALRATDSLVPGVMRSVRAAQAVANLQSARVEVFITDSPQMNAFCMELDGGFAVVFTAPLLERMTEGELAFITGHEFGHAAYGHLKLPSSAILAIGKGVDPRLALALMAWNRRGELSCDRLGLLCCRNLQDAATALIKIASGLGGSVLRFSMTDYIAQMSELQKLSPSGADAADWYASHPFSPLRVAALNEFWGSALAPAEAGAGPRRPHVELEDRVETLLRAMEPVAPAGDPPAVRDLLLWGGLAVAAADGKVLDSEKASLRQAVGDAAIEGALAALRAAGNEPAATALLRERLAAAAKACASLPSPDRHALIQRLVVIARADLDLAPQELAGLRGTAEAIGLDPGFVDKIIALFA